MVRVLTAAEFNAQSIKYGWKWVKFTRESECHHGFQFKTGENIDAQEFKPHTYCNNGLYFCRDTDVHLWAPGHDFVRDVTIPDDSPHMIVINDISHTAKVHAFVLGEKRALWTPDTCDAVVQLSRLQ